MKCCLLLCCVVVRCGVLWYVMLCYMYAMRCYVMSWYGMVWYGIVCLCYVMLLLLLLQVMHACYESCACGKELRHANIKLMHARTCRRWCEREKRHRTWTCGVVARALKYVACEYACEMTCKSLRKSSKGDNKPFLYTVVKTVVVVFINSTLRSCSADPAEKIWSSGNLFTNLGTLDHMWSLHTQCNCQ